MIACWRIDAVISQPQSFYWNAASDVRFDDLGYVLKANAAIPNLIRINHNIRSMLALIQTSSFIGANCGLEAARGDGIFKRPVQLTCCGRIAARPSASRLPPIGANEDMVLVLCHQCLA